MGQFGGFYKGEQKKKKKLSLDKKGASFSSGSTWELPRVEIIPKGKFKQK